ncbi:hypothetical protein VRRI112168_02370 [Vreelandella rituensis]|uniref:Guanylate kinase-like domain-containing protein n=1 Tax=Vreelandella rituensis TaxID=2282306 RepID=A0A368UBB3_9GAMM|nr:hypothetical protein [Halomonas rituensis]RCV93592.1 hypothetical protein DU506_00110 [Halomonas rituensis]
MLMTLTGPTGSGKSTLAQALCDAGVLLIPSWTTRALRPGEAERGDMVQVTAEQMAQSAMLEIADYDGHRYGTPVTDTVTAALAGECDALKIVEPEGLRSIRQTLTRRGSWHQLAHVYVDVDENTAVRRLLSRCHGHPASADRRRIERAARECRDWPLACDWLHVVDNTRENATLGHLADEVMASVRRFEDRIKLLSPGSETHGELGLLLEGLTAHADNGLRDRVTQAREALAGPAV